MKALLFALVAATLPVGVAHGQPAAGAGVKTLSSAPPPADLLGVNGAQLGMTLEAWKALPYKAGPTSHMTTSCMASPEPAGGVQRVQTSQRSNLFVCSYVTRYGQTVLQQSFPLTAAFLARSPSYAFVDGRLSRIEFHTSVNAFISLDALLTARFGAPVQTVRDTL
jgi:hypothetical protein